MGRPPKYNTPEERAAYLEARRKDRHKVSERHTTKRTGDRHKKGYVPPKRVDMFSHSAFLTWDGEALGIVRPVGEADYVYALLMGSAGDIAPLPGKPRPYGLGTVECFETLLRGAHAHPDAIHVIYSGNLDVNKMFRDLPRKVLARINEGKFTTWTVSRKLAYGILWLPRHELLIGRFVEDASQRWKTITKSDGTTKLKPQFSDKIRLWDVFTFWQCSFLRALRDNFSDEELKELDFATIAAGKDHRVDFTMNELHSEIIPYTRLEVRATVALMEKLRRDIGAMNERLLERKVIATPIKLKRWDGSGALAGAFMEKFGLRKVIEAAREKTPSEVEQAALHAFSAGRSECIQYGHYNGPVFAYDINSAHPSSQVEMPDLSQGIWEHHVN